MQKNWVSWLNGIQALLGGNSQRSSREVEVVPEILVVIHDSTHQVQQWLALHLSGDAV
jgi:hypothetical protein